MPQQQEQNPVQQIQKAAGQVGEALNGTLKAGENLINQARLELMKKGQEMIDGIGKTIDNLPNQIIGGASGLGNAVSGKHPNSAIEQADRLENPGKK